MTFAAAATVLGLVALPHAEWIPTNTDTHLDFAGVWRLADTGDQVSLTIMSDGAVSIEGWPRDLACREEKTGSLVTKADLDWQAATRLTGWIDSTSDASTLHMSFAASENVCASQQTFFIEVNTRDGRLRLLWFINGVTDEDEGIEPLVFYRDDGE